MIDQKLSNTTINIIEIFKSIQGETTFSGLPTTFIRLAACNLRCTWCDTPYSFGRGSALSLASILDRTAENQCRYVCVTGGEPLLQSNVHPLMRTLCDRGYRVSIETGGSLPIQTIDERVVVILDIKCPGSGMQHRNLWENIPCLKPGDEVKFVIKDRIDYEYALEVCRSRSLFDQPLSILFSPVFNQLEPRLLVEWILADQLPVRLNLQLHKFIWPPETRGV